MIEPTFATGTVLDDAPTSNILQVFLWTGTDLMDRPIGWADVVEPVFPGYARVGNDAIGPAYVPTESIVLRRAEQVVFTCTGIAAGVVAKGYGVRMWDGTGVVLLHVERFDAPIPMDAAGKRIVLDVDLAAYDGAAYAG